MTIREKYHISEKHTNLITVARMSIQKNPFFLIEIVEELLKYVPDLMMNWVGDGELKKEVENKIREKGIYENFHFLGVSEHVEEILPCCDLFLLPSQYEGFGRVFIEAQAAGIPVFASDMVPREVDCGGCTFVSLNKTAKEWAEQIYCYMKKNRRVEISRALLSRFDIKNTVIEMERFYDNMLKKRDRKTLRILYINDLFIYGGIESYIISVIDNIDREKYKIDVLLPGTSFHSNESALMKRNVCVLKFYETDMAKRIQEFRKIFADGKYDIVHIMLPYISIDYAFLSLLWRPKYRYKIILHSHNSWQVENMPSAKKVVRAKILFQMADYRVACSEDAGRFLFGKHGRYDVLYNGIDIQKFMRDRVLV